MSDEKLGDSENVTVISDKEVDDVPENKNVGLEAPDSIDNSNDLLEI